MNPCVYLEGRHALRRKVDWVNSQPHETIKKLELFWQTMVTQEMQQAEYDRHPISLGQSAQEREHQLALIAAKIQSHGPIFDVLSTPVNLLYEVPLSVQWYFRTSVFLFSFIYSYFRKTTLLNYYDDCINYNNLTACTGGVRNLFYENQWFFKEIMYLALIHINPPVMEDIISQATVYHNKIMAAMADVDAFVLSNQESGNPPPPQKRWKKVASPSVLAIEAAPRSITRPRPYTPSHSYAKMLLTTINYTPEHRVPDFIKNQITEGLAYNTTVDLIMNARAILTNPTSVYFSIIPVYYFITIARPEIVPTNLSGFCVYVQFFTLTHLRSLAVDTLSKIESQVVERVHRFNV
jgi:hypothetical protein